MHAQLQTLSGRMWTTSRCLLGLANAGVNLENMRFELALRGLGRRDASVAKMLIEVDQQRLRLFEGKFLRLTNDTRSATDLAALFYLAIAGSNLTVRVIDCRAAPVRRAPRGPSAPPVPPA